MISPTRLAKTLHCNHRIYFRENHFFGLNLDMPQGLKKGIDIIPEVWKLEIMEI